MFKRGGFNLIEVLITVSVFTALGMLMAVLTEQFIGTYMRSRELSDLQRMATALFDEIESGDNLGFDGLRNSVELVEAGARSISFVPTFRDNSQTLGDYLPDLMNSFQLEGPPSQNSEPSGGLRVQFNSSTNRYELRWYLSKHPRAGSLEPQVYLHSSNQALGAEEDTAYPSSRSLPGRLVVQPPANGGTTPVSYIVFTGGAAPLFFPGGAQSPPAISEVQEIMTTNPAQLFPNPFSNPNDRLSVFYHPETEGSIISDQESLMAHLILKDESFDPLRPLWDLASSPQVLDQVLALPENSLFLLYNDQITALPSRTALLNSNLSSFRIQFPAEFEGKPASRFSYMSSKSTSAPLQMVSIDGASRLPNASLGAVSTVKLDFLAVMGGLMGENASETLMRQQFSSLIPLETRSYSQAIHTRASTIEPARGFARGNCLPGALPTLRCRHITSHLPSGADIRLSETFFLSSLSWDSEADQSLEGSMNIIIRSSQNQRVLKIEIDFDNSRVRVQKKNSYTEEDLMFDPDVTESDVVAFPLDNSQFLNLTNLQVSGFLDEDFNYSSPFVYSDHLGDSDLNDLFIELSVDCNLEGFNLVWKPR